MEGVLRILRREPGFVSPTSKTISTQNICTSTKEFSQKNGKRRRKRKSEVKLLHEQKKQKEEKKRLKKKHVATPVDSGMSKYYLILIDLFLVF